MGNNVPRSLSARSRYRQSRRRDESFDFESLQYSIEQSAAVSESVNGANNGLEDNVLRPNGANNGFEDNVVLRPYNKTISVSQKENELSPEKISAKEGESPDKESNKLMGVLLVHVLKAEEIKLIKVYPYVVVSFGGKSFRTYVNTKTNFPVWKQRFRFAVVNAQLKYDIIFSLFNADIMKKNGFVGTSLVSLSDIRLSENGKMETWLDIRSSQHQHQGEIVGRILVELEFQEKEVIESKFWAALTAHFDTNGDHHLDRFELAGLFQTLGYSLSKDELTELFRKLASKDDHELTASEISELPRLLPEGFSVIRFKECPICRRSLRKASDGALICHVGLCFEENGARAIDEILAKNLITEQNASAGWTSYIIRTLTFSTYSNSRGRILVQSRKSGALIEEKIPPYVKVPLMIMYQTYLGKSSLKTNDGRNLLKKMTVEFGPRYNDPASKKLIPDFIALHDLDITEVEQPISSFPNFNEFFYRKLKPGVRPIADPDDSSVAVCVADSRCLVFPRVADATRLWVKGRRFSLRELIGDEGLGNYFENGSVVIFRLAPQDYHRYHSPVDGIMHPPVPIDGAYFTVSPLAVRQDIDVFTENKRTRVVFETENFGLVAMLIVGATCVGSIIVTHPPGLVTKGSEVGYFAFGGSTVILVYRKGSIKFDDDLLENSGKPLETLVRYGTSLGRSRPHSPPLQNGCCLDCPS
mmetsp:Transcript_45585/g.74289  ORF Transcript_45585/g.74289 Transcript_45585/m.74289 type:complete len:701 (-) Transcript_45585:1096-3198(-)